MTALAEACEDLARWLPRAAALIPVPDADGTTGRGQPCSAPPWNSEAAGVVFDAIGEVADLRAELAQAVHGRLVDRLPDRQTGRALEAVGRLGAAMDYATASDAARRLSGLVSRIMALRAIDEGDADKPLRVRAACPYCGTGMLRMLPRSGRVTCLAFGACLDANGEHPRGVLQRSQLSGGWAIYWRDGAVT